MLKCGGMEERNEFSLAVLKWSTNMFEKSKIDIKNTETIYTNYQKTFGHFDIHRDFAINLWKGFKFKSNFGFSLFLFYF